MYKLLVKPLFFLFSPELAHHMAMKGLSITLQIPILGKLISNYFRGNFQNESVKINGLTFRNRVGLAAGFDKDGKYIRALEALGFGFIEVGTVTPRPQIGNEKPRLFRLSKDEALINRMGFNNEGVEALAKRLAKIKNRRCIIGGNIGKNKVTSNEQATDDYVFCLEKLYPYVDYFVVNVSSPNTPGLRALQSKEPLTKLLSTLQTHTVFHQGAKPIFLKVAPDLSYPELDDIIEICQNVGIAGLIATNTTISRKNLRTPLERLNVIGNGGLSGTPLKQRSDEITRYLSERSDGSLTIIGVGGVSNPQDGTDKLNMGADLIQVYTGFIYNGPGFIRSIRRHLGRTNPV